MNTPEAWSLLAQIPLVGIFIAYVLYTRSLDTKVQDRREESWRQLIREQQTAFTTAIDKISVVLSQVSSKLEEHDRSVDKRLSIIEKHREE